MAAAPRQLAGAALALRAAAALALALAGELRAEPGAARVESTAAPPEASPGSPDAPRADAGAGSPEPALPHIVEAALRRAAGSPSDEASRASRARGAHWAPVIRGQYGLRDDGRTRRGQVRLAPLVEDDVAQSRSWAVVATWDLSQVVYARDEAQLALAHVHLARVRREVAQDAVRLHQERWRLRAALRLAPAGATAPRVDLLLALVRTTAELEALTGLFGAQLAQAEEQVAALEPQLSPGSVSPPDSTAPARKPGRRPSAAPAPSGPAPAGLPEPGASPSRSQPSPPAPFAEDTE